MPYLVFRDECVKVLFLIGTRHALQFRDVLLHGSVGVIVGLKEALVRGDLVSAQASLLVDDELLDVSCRCV